MPRKKSEAVPEGNGPVPQQEEFGSDKPTLVNIYRLFEERLNRQQKKMATCSDRWDRKLDKMAEDWRNMDQHLTSLEQDARQPCLAMVAGGPADTKTRERTEHAATAVQAMHGDSCSATRVDPDPKTNSTSSGMKVEPPVLSCRDDGLVENGDASPKSCLPSLEMRSPSAASGSLLTGETSTATKITFNQPPLQLDSTRFVRQQLLEPACCPLLQEGH